MASPWQEWLRTYADALRGYHRHPETKFLHMLRWLVQQVNERGLKMMAGFLGYDAANLAKVVVGKRGLSRKLRQQIDERMISRKMIRHEGPARERVKARYEPQCF